jgi:hypothetical protein
MSPERIDMSPLLRTALTDRLGCRYPIVQTAMGWVADANLVIATTRAGGFGFLAGATIAADQLEAEIRKVIATGGSNFGLNFHMFQDNAAQCVDLAIQHKPARRQLRPRTRQEDDRPLQGGRRAVHPHGGRGQARGEGRGAGRRHDHHPGRGGRRPHRRRALQPSSAAGARRGERAGGRRRRLFHRRGLARRWRSARRASPWARAS